MHILFGIQVRYNNSSMPPAPTIAAYANFRENCKTKMLKTY